MIIQTLEGRRAFILENTRIQPPPHTPELSLHLADEVTPIWRLTEEALAEIGLPAGVNFLVTGGVNAQNLPVVRQIYEQMPEPKVVVAVGTCACTGGVFRECYNMLGGMDKAIPVDVYVPGCAARPESIIAGVVKGLSVLEEKHRKLKASGNHGVPEEPSKEFDGFTEEGRKS